MKAIVNVYWEPENSAIFGHENHLPQEFSWGEFFHPVNFGIHIFYSTYESLCSSDAIIKSGEIIFFNDKP